jgi:hypothetical protein
MSLKTDIQTLALNGGSVEDAMKLVAACPNKAAGWTPEVVAHVVAHAADAQVAPKAKAPKVAKVKAAKFVPVMVAGYLPLAYQVYVDGAEQPSTLNLLHASVGKQGAMKHYALLSGVGQKMFTCTVTANQAAKLATGGNVTVFYGAPPVSHKLRRS